MVERDMHVASVTTAQSVPPSVPPQDLVFGDNRRLPEAATDGSEGPYTDLETMARMRTRDLGPAARPVAVPEDLADASLRKASGSVELPLHSAGAAL
jgi:hypothetical protein